MGSNTKNRERKDGILNFLLFAVPLVGILIILLSKDQHPTIKVITSIATLVGLIAGVIYFSNY